MNGPQGCCGCLGEGHLLELGGAAQCALSMVEETTTNGVL